MIKALEKALEKVRSLPPERQEYAASVLEQIVADDGQVYRLSDEERAAVQQGLDDLDAGRVVPDAEMTAFWSRRGA
jgi:predicted transcriptional regulator